MTMTSRGIEVTLTEQQAAEVLARYDVFRSRKGWVYRPNWIASDDPFRSPIFADRESAIADAYIDDNLGEILGPDKA